MKYPFRYICKVIFMNGNKFEAEPVDFSKKADILPLTHRNRGSLLLCILHHKYTMFDYKSGVNSLNKADGDFIEL